jgi:hypothetical protein
MSTDDTTSTTQDEGRSTAEAASGDDAERGNLDGSTAYAEPRQDALEAAQTQAEGQADAERESGQDNGLSS